MNRSDTGRLVLSSLAGALVLLLVGYTLARRLRNRKRLDRGPRRILLEDSKRKAVGEGTLRRPSLRSLPERSFSRR
jgi:hypothetical protein